MTKKNDKKGKPEKSPLNVGQLLAMARRKLRISWYINAITLMCIIVVGGLTGYYAIVTLNETKLKDTWSILFLEMENTSDNLRKTLNKMSGNSRRDIAGSGQSDLIFEFDGRATSRMELASQMSKADGAYAEITADKIGYDVDLPSLSQYIALGNQVYMVRPDHNKSAYIEGRKQRFFLNLYKVDLTKSLAAYLKSDSTRVYLINRKGSLLYSNDPGLSEDAMRKSPVMAHFVGKSLAFGQIETENEQGQKIYAFFREIAGTNIILFSEVKKHVALAPVKTAETKFWLVLFGAVGFAGLVVQIPLAYIRKPLSRLIEQTHKVGTGDFTTRAEASGFGEVRILSESFETMAVSLAERDRRIQLLLVESRKMALMEQELLIAKGIQENLLPEQFLPAEANVEVYTSYLPAQEVAGDWYSYHYNEDLCETLIVISDVSGHGAGSSMFTSIIAEIFEDFRERNASRSFPLADFSQVVNRRLLKFGRGGWHSTMAVVKLGKTESDIEYLNAGHTPLIIKNQEGAKLLKVPSIPLGIEPVIEPQIRRVSFPPGSSAMLYTDGLIEARGKKNTSYGLKRLYKTLEAQESISSKRMVDGVIKNWRSHVTDVPQNDDICLIGFKKTG
jgi:serine phosphatase RsbU (regulator of sigma subunit)